VVLNTITVLHDPFVTSLPCTFKSFFQQTLVFSFLDSALTTSFHPNHEIPNPAIHHVLQGTERQRQATTHCANHQCFILGDVQSALSYLERLITVTLFDRFHVQSADERPWRFEKGVRSRRNKNPKSQTEYNLHSRILKESI